MCEVTRVELPSAQHTLQNRTLWRVGDLGLAAGISQPTLIRRRAVEGQRDEPVGTATGTLLKQLFYILGWRVPSSVRYGTHEWLVIARPRD